MKTNVEILAAAYAGTQRAADDMAALQTAVDAGACITSAELLPKLRNELRDALNAVQELKTRAKQRSRLDANSRKPETKGKP